MNTKRLVNVKYDCTSAAKTALVMSKSTCIKILLLVFGGVCLCVCRVLTVLCLRFEGCVLCVGGLTVKCASVPTCLWFQ